MIIFTFISTIFIVVSNNDFTFAVITTALSYNYVLYAASIFINVFVN